MQETLREWISELENDGGVFMFFIMGISQKEKKLKFSELKICKCCGKYGRMEVFVTYTYLMLFFVPIIKWNKRYIVRMGCCGSTANLAPEIGKKIEQGQLESLDEDKLNFEHYENHAKYCSECGYTTMEDFQFCPKCGKSFK